MKDISQYLTPAYYTALSGVGLPIYDGMAPDTEKGSYIVIGEIQSSQDQDKAGYMFTVNILIDICIKNANFGFLDADNYANIITGLINSDSQPNLSPNFQVVRTHLLSSNRLTGLNKTEPIFRRLLRYEHSIVQI
jgi:hypothetical protein